MKIYSYQYRSENQLVSLRYRYRSSKSVRQHVLKKKGSLHPRIFTKDYYPVKKFFYHIDDKRGKLSKQSKLRCYNLLKPIGLSHNWLRDLWLRAI